MFISLDLETTGLDPSKDKIIEFGAIKFDINQKKAEEKLQILINPGIKIPKIITHITKIKDSDTENAPSFEEVQQEIKTFIGDLPIIGHNIKFDTEFLRANGIELNNQEYDTYELSSILLPQMNSYSLEVITQTLNLKHEEKHRALDDAIAAKELFLELLRKFQNLPPKLIQEIQSILKKSDWDLKNLFLEIEPSTQNPQEKGKEQQKTPPQLTSNYKKIIEEEESAIFEENPPYTNLIKDLSSKASEKTYISLPSLLFYEIEKEISDNIAKIDLSKNYLSLKRFEEFKKKEAFDENETTAILKCLIWLETTQTGLLQELQILQEEWPIFNQLRTDKNIIPEEEEPFIQKALKKDENNPTICTHNYLLENLQNLTHQKPNTIIIDLESFHATLLKKHSFYINPELPERILNELKISAPENKTIETLLSKTAILFGLLGMIFEKHNDHNDFNPICMPTPAVTSEKDWLNAKELLQNLIAISFELNEVKSQNTTQPLKDWKEVLTSLDIIFNPPTDEKSLIWIEKNLDNQPVLRKIPLNINIQMEKFLAETNNYKFIGECVDLSDDGNFIKTAYGLPQGIKLHKADKKSENLNIIITEDSAGYDKTQVPAFLSEYIHQKNEKIALVCSSKQRIKDISLFLSEQKIPTISQMTGSITKINDQFAENSDLPVIMTNYAWENFHHQNKIETLFIDKIPFDSPSADHIIAISPNFEDPFNQMQIPRAILSLKKIINKLDNTSPKKIVIFDSRILTKQYGESFIKALQNMSSRVISLKTKEIFTIDFSKIH